MNQIHKEVKMEKKDLNNYRKTRLVKIVKEEYEFQKKLWIDRLPTMTLEELESYKDNIVIGKEVEIEIKKRKEQSKKMLRK